MTLTLAAAAAGAEQSSPVKQAVQENGQTAAPPQLVWPLPPQRPRIRYLGSISGPDDIGRKKGFWRKLWEFVRGDEEDEHVVRPMAVTVDSRDRLLVADTRRGRVHIFDRREGEYTYLQGSEQTDLHLPIGLAVDGADNIYVADGELNKIFVFAANGKFDHLLDVVPWLSRPAALAIDRDRRLLYVVDTPAHNVKVVDLATGKLSRVIGRRGEAAGEFNFPTYAALDRHGHLAITDSMNARIQIFDPEGRYVSAFGQTGDGSGDFAAPKGVAFDSEGHVYVADAGFDNVQIFDQTGRLLLFWGTTGQNAGTFWLPTGLAIDAQDRVYVADSYNSRVQVFQYLGDRHAQ